MTKRTDKHAPSTFDPAAYTYQGTAVLYWGSATGELAKELHAELEALNERAKDGGYVGNFLNKGTCDHCGAHFHYGAEYKHTDGEVIVVGHTCADVSFGCMDRRGYDLRQAKRRTKVLRERVKRQTQADLFLRARPELGDVFAESNRTHDSKAGDILSDLYTKLHEWGSLTDKQIAFAHKLALDLTTVPTCEFCGDEGHKAKDCTNRGKVPVSDTRIEITACIVSTRSEEARYGYHAGVSYKALYQLPNGAKLWGTIPNALFTNPEDDAGELMLDDLKGCYVTFTAAVQPSDDDPSFGFIKRPTKAVHTAAFRNSPVLPEPVASGDLSDEDLRATLVKARAKK